MLKKIVIKLTKAGPSAGPFKITTQEGVVVADNLSKKQLIEGVSFMIDELINHLYIESIGNCNIKKLFELTSFTIIEYSNVIYKESKTGCLWKHLTDVTSYNYFYGEICPYILEYPFSFQFQDEILQNVKDYTKAYVYNSIPGFEFDMSNKVEVDDKWFNKAILYNGQQSSGILNLVPKPKNNLKEYTTYPIINADSKTIIYTKSDNFYQYNTFWALNKSPYIPLFITSCENLSIDKIVNQDNMDYSTRSFKKSPIRAKELKVRHILDNRIDVHLVSQFIVSPNMLSYK